MNLQSKEFHQLIYNTFTELPWATSGVGKNREWIPISNPELNGEYTDWSEYTSPFEPYYEPFITIHNLNNKNVSFRFSPVNSEISIYIDNVWSGYFDDALVCSLMMLAKERGIPLP